MFLPFFSGSFRTFLRFDVKPGAAFEWSQPLTLSESMTTYRGFFRQRCGGEAETVEVAVARDKVSGFLRLTLAHCRQVGRTGMVG
jgi:hypothetical protein